MVGAQVEGFETMVRLSDSSNLAVFEGDEYLSSPIDPRPKFHLYKPHIALISGIAWDHINVFPTFDVYKEQFSAFIDLMEENGTLYYYDGDTVMHQILEKSSKAINKIPYAEHQHMIHDNITYLLTQTGSYKLYVFGKHNLQNINGAKLICKQLGISDVDFYKAITTFKGAARRLQVLKDGSNSIVYLDFAHAPSKVKATITALKEQYPNRKLYACLELHTFSSLNTEFLEQYKHSMSEADKAIVYFNPETIKNKRLPELTAEKVKQAFGDKNLEIFTDTAGLKEYLKSNKYMDINILLMSSGNFGGLDMAGIAKEIIQ
jgi:UDP-N-acetylmuramate: L-alanyl-gamma-D-glutamyl-meso-diaminopimelate ligase